MWLLHYLGNSLLQMDNNFPPFHDDDESVCTYLYMYSIILSFILQNMRISFATGK